jgi:hypothetical protein
LISLAIDEKVEFVAAIEKTGPFAEAGCSYLDFRFRVARDKFKLADFSESMKSKGLADLPSRLTVTCLTQFPEKTDYHVHFAWNDIEEKDLELWVSYHNGSLPPREDEKEPYAEQFMQWLGQFFVADSANVEVQGRIGYPSTLRRSRYLLPVKVSIIPGIDTSIDGISIDLPSKPSGIDTARLTVGAKNLALVLSGVVKLSFDKFDVFEHLGNVSRLALSLTDLRKSS